MISRTYLDYNATTPLHPDVVNYVKEATQFFGNPSSIHWAGRETKRILTEARELIGNFINCDPLEIIFTAGGSEANNLALKGVLHQMTSRQEIICSSVEHPSVLKTMEYLKSEGYRIHWLKVLRDGRVDLNQLDKLLSDKVALVSLQLVNNETGNIFPVKEVALKAHASGALVHSDMVQALGKIQVDVRDLDVDLASFAGHKFYALKGAGFLYAKKGTHLVSLVHGGGQERSRRAGTENALAIGSLATSIKVLGPQMLGVNGRIAQMRDGLEKRILATISGSHVNGAGAPRVPNTTNIMFDDIDGETLLINLDTRGFAVSSGAACSSGSNEPSPVLVAMGLNSEEASQSLRVSLGWMTTPEELENFYNQLVEAVKQMREIHTLDAQAERELA